MIAPLAHYIGRGDKYEKLFNVEESISKQNRSDKHVQFSTHIRVPDSNELYAHFKKSHVSIALFSSGKFSEKFIVASES